MMYFSDIQDKMYELEEEIIACSTSLLPEQRKALQIRFTRNLRTYTVLYGDDFIAIPKDANGNWRYYAGFEYIEGGADYHFDSYVVYSAFGDDDRVKDVLDLLDDTLQKVMNEHDSELQEH